MKPKKAYILKTTDPRSISQAEDVVASCNRVGISWEYVEWFHGKPQESWEAVDTKIDRITGNPNAQCCFSGHIKIWEKIIESGEPGIVLEHDGIMLHKIDIDIPEQTLVVLGYKLENIDRYDYKTAGPPQEIIETNGNGHEGSHAYVITPDTAKTFLEEVVKNGIRKPIDNQFFLKSRQTQIPIRIMSPTPAIGWIRESTIQRKSGTRNYDFIDSFKNHLL